MKWSCHHGCFKNVIIDPQSRSEEYPVKKILQILEPHPNYFYKTWYCLPLHNSRQQTTILWCEKEAREKMQVQGEISQKHIIRSGSSFFKSYRTRSSSSGKQWTMFALKFLKMMFLSRLIFLCILKKFRENVKGKSDLFSSLLTF